MNAPDSYGAGALAMNNVDGIRQNTAYRYLISSTCRMGKIAREGFKRGNSERRA